MKYICSFGFKRGKPEGKVIDLRLQLRNPYHNKKLRYLTGRDPRVKRDIEKSPNFHKVFQQVLDTAKELKTHEILWVGCTGGHHRSVAIAEMVAEELGISVHHRDINK